MLELLYAKLLKRKNEMEHDVLTHACPDYLSYRESVARYDELAMLLSDIDDIIKGKEDE